MYHLNVLCKGSISQKMTILRSAACAFLTTNLKELSHRYLKNLPCFFAKLFFQLFAPENASKQVGE
jgi:hypothetical protein